MTLPSGYDPHIASRLCFLSDLAYDCFRKEEQNPGGSVCYENFAFIVRREGENTYVAFQGSNDIKDFVLDACFLITSPDSDPTFPPVHAGFWKATEALIDVLREELSKGEPQSLYFGGHSLGKGIAVIMALRLAEMGYPVKGVYGFGGPPVGAVKFYNYYSRFQIPTFLLVYRRDGVPFLQPKGVHVSPLVFLDERAYPLKSRPGFPWFNPFRWSAWRDDHDSQNYLASTAKILDRSLHRD